MAPPVKKDSPMSNHIRQMMTSAGMEIRDLAFLLNKSPQVISNKLSRGTFSFDELLAITEATGGFLYAKYVFEKEPREYNFEAKDFCSEDTCRRITESREMIRQKKMKRIEDAFRDSDPETVKAAFEKYIAEHPLEIEKICGGK